MAAPEMISIHKIKPNPSNPRTISDEKLSKLVTSIKQFPDMLKARPIVINKDNIVLGGNMRLKAAQSAGLKDVPVFYAESWTEEQEREFIIKDNVGFGEWDWQMLANDWDTDQLSEWGLDVPEMKVETLEAEEDDFDTTFPEEPKTVLGDLYEIGEHRLLCGDSTDSDAVAKLMNGVKADMVFTDPPYDLIDLSYTDMLFMFTLGHIFILNSEQRNVDISAKHRDLLTRWYAVDFRQAHLISNNAPMTRADFIAEFRNSEKVKFYNQNKGFSNLLQIAKIHSNKGETPHKQEKKIELPAVFIEHFTKTQEVILDLFLGSGSTMVAAHQLKRKCYGIELDHKYCDVIVKRMITLDPALTIKRNGIDVTQEWK